MKKIIALVALMLLSVASLEAGKKIVVNLSKQEACAYENGHAVFCGNISTGKPGHRTPVGYFHVLEKALRHVSSRYPRPNGGARMDYMLRITGYGVAMHLGYVPNYPASHGCIRMENGFAQRMFSWAHVGTPVIVRGIPPRYVDRSSGSTLFSSSSDISQSTRHSRSHKRSTKSYAGNTPLKLLSSVPGKSESVQFKTKKLTKRSRHRIRHLRRHKYKRRVITENEKPVTPLGMLRS